MIYGKVNARDEAIVTLGLLDDGDTVVKMDAVVDTGFTGYLTLRPSTLHRLNWTRAENEEVTLADGSESTLRVYHGTILWDGKRLQVSAYAVDDRPLIGMKLMRGHLLTMECNPDGDVSIEEA